MTLSKKLLLACAFVQLAMPAFAATPASPTLSAAERHARRCQHHTPSRDINPQGTLLWGTKQQWDTRKAAGEQSSVLVAADLAAVSQAKEGVKALRLEGGRLVAATETGAPAADQGLAGVVLQGLASDGQPVEVALCGVEPSAEDASMAWYRIEAWNPVAQEWENPCVATGRVPNPRVLAVGGVWDERGAHHDVAGKVTFACENGVISKCAAWGYQPWASRDGRSLAEAHQACTRMARADYCGNGQSHTREGTMIEYYDSLGVSRRATEATAGWNPARASFEAAWAADGAACLARTRDGEPLAAILRECPGRFRKGEVDLGDGDRCSIQRAEAGSTPLVRNRVANRQKGRVAQAEGK